MGGYNFPGLQVAWPMQVQLTGCNFKGDVTNAPVSGVTEPSVDILDIARFAYAYGTSIQQPIPVNSALTYPPSYFKYFVDITTLNDPSGATPKPDGTINITDISLAALNFGKGVLVC